MELDNLVANPRRPETRERLAPGEKRGRPREAGRDTRPDILPRPAAPREQMGESGADIPSARVMPDLPGEGAVPRDFKITRNIVDRYGATDGCPGCRHTMRPNTPRRVHNGECRRRMEENMKEDPTARAKIDERDVRHGMQAPQEAEAEG